MLLLVLALNQWRVADFGSLDYAKTMRLVIPGATLSRVGISNGSFKFFREHFGDAAAMNLGERIHGRYIHNRRARVLSNSMASLIPEHFQVLDVGCGDGLLAHLIAQKRPDLKLTGVDVLLRDRGHIPVAQFDGQSLPYGDASFDAVMFVDVLHQCRESQNLVCVKLRVSPAGLSSSKIILWRDFWPVQRFVSWIMSAMRAMAWRCLMIIGGDKNGLILL